MALTVPDVIVEQEGILTFIDGYGLPGGTIQSIYVYEDLNAIPGDEEVETAQVDFFVLSPLGPNDIGAIINAVAQQVAEHMGQTIAISAMWERAEQQVTLPTQFCIADNCVTLPPEFCVGPICIPLGGSTVASGYSYRMWLLMRTHQQAMPMTAFPQGITFGAAFMLAILGVAAIVGILAIYGLNTGKASWKDIIGVFQGFTPGENIAKPIVASAIPLIALGLTLVGAALLFPAVSGSLNAQVPGIGGVGGTVATAPVTYFQPPVLADSGRGGRRR